MPKQDRVEDGRVDIRNRALLDPDGVAPLRYPLLWFVAEKTGQVAIAGLQNLAYARSVVFALGTPELDAFFLEPTPRTERIVGASSLILAATVVTVSQM